MTKINRIILRGFKSFANKTELLFGDRFNVILGPNGSGKSNIFDAICFVLGKGSTKSLRAERAANLIYNGGKTKKAAKEGEVSIFFDNAKKTFPTEDPFVKITRIVRSSGQSVYKINDKARTRQQILDLLAIARINPDGYNIILQGDIVRFVEMSAEERRLIVEEIAGISVYEEKKEKALKELEKVDLKISEAEIVLKERDGYLKDLKKDRDQAMKYRELGSRIQQNKASLIKMQLDRKKAENDKSQSEISGYKVKVDAVQKTIDDLKTRIDADRKEIARLNEEVEKRGEKEQVVMHKEVEQLRVNIATHSTKIASLKNELERIATRKEQLQKNFEEINTKISGLADDKKRIELEKAGKEKELLRILAKIDSFRKDNKIDAAGNIEKDIEELDKKADEKQAEIQQLREQQQNLLREKDRTEFQSKSISDRVNKVLEVEKQNKKEIDDLKRKKERFKFATLELNKLLSEDVSLASQLVNARKGLMDYQEQLGKLRAKNATISERIAGSEAIKNIMENRGKFGEVYGTVAELGNVQSKYATALEIAAGPHLKSIVVEDDITAAKCIKHLKTNRLGTATFLPLNKIKDKPVTKEQDKLKEANGAHGFAIDLISYDNRFKKIFSYVFGSTLVVDNIDVARRIGIGTAKMVTLDGDMAEVSGAMHGGYRQKKGGAFQEKEVAEELARMEEKVTDTEKVISVIERKRAETDERITALREEKATVEGEIIKTEKSLHLDTGDLDVSKKILKELEDESKSLETRLNEVMGKISTTNRELAQLKIRKQEMRAKIGELRNPTLLAELNTFEQKKEELRIENGNLINDLKNIETQSETILRPEISNIQKILKQHEKEAEKFNNDIKDLGTLIKEEEQKLKEKEKEEKQFYSQFKELFTKRNKLNDDMQKTEISVIGREEEIRKVEQKMNLISIDNARVRAELAALEEEFRQYEGVEILNKEEEELRKEINQFERMVQDIGNVNLRALEIYEAVEREYNILMEKKEKLSSEKQDVLVMINEIESKKTELFLKTLEVVTKDFKEIFSALSTKGAVELELENQEKPFEGGLMIKVRLTGSKFLDIKSLSGGEKTMTALAFIFAIQEHDPASFYVFDEVDAALDKKNSEQLSKLIAKYADKAQYVVVSHNDGIISNADNLYGVSMDEHGMSKVVSLKI